MKSNLTSKYVANLTIENFPSRVELFALLNNFLEKSDFPKDYTNDNKDSSITFSFLNTVRGVTKI